MDLRDDINLCVQLKEARIEKQLTLQDIADCTGFSSSYIQRIENGNQPNFSFRLLFKLINLYDIDINSLKVQQTFCTYDYHEAKEDLAKLQNFFEEKKMMLSADLLFAIERSLDE